jgi:hypothetical protein
MVSYGFTNTARPAVWLGQYVVGIYCSVVAWPILVSTSTARLNLPYYVGQSREAE